MKVPTLSQQQAPRHDPLPSQSPNPQHQHQLPTTPLTKTPPAPRSHITARAQTPTARNTPSPNNNQTTTANNPPDTVHYSFVQWNVGGIRFSKAKLEDFLCRHKVKVAALQETKLHDSSSTPSFANYALIRKDRSRNTGGGLAFLIHLSITFTHLPTDLNNDPVLEIQGITAEIRGAPLNIYI